MSYDHLNDRPREEVEALARVYRHMSDEEIDGGHIQRLYNNFASRIGNYAKYNGEIIWPESEPSLSDMRTALELAEAHLDSTEWRELSSHATTHFPSVSDELLNTV